MKPKINEDCVLTEISKEGEGAHVEQEEDSPKRPSTREKEQSSIKQKDDDQLIQSAKAQMGEVREENERLKQLLSDIVKDYQTLQTHFSQIMKQEEADRQKIKKMVSIHQESEETELVSLSLGRGNSSEPKNEEKKSGNNSSERKEDAKFSDEGLSLALDCKFEADSSVAIKNRSSENSFGESKEEEPTETWVPSKVLKTMRSADDEESQQPPMKKARVSVRARCDTPTMHDGCQWRKYGQKIAKGNPCPRAYYRCTISPTCPVRKQVQRCVEDMSILITTYEGTHNHPLPLSATAMASTTSAAASMLNSRLSASQQAGSLGASISAPLMSTSTLPSGLNFSLSQTTTRPHQFPFPNTSISTANSHPTITLDLTTPNGIPSHHFNDRFASSAAARYPQACLNLSSPSPPSTSWNTNYPAHGSFSKEHLYQSNYTQMNNGNQTINPSSQQEITAEAVKAIIASNPMFRSALAAAITSFAGNGSGGVRDNTTTPGFGEHISGLNLKLGQSLGFKNTMLYSSSSSQNGTTGCGSTYLSKPSLSLSSQQVGLALFPPSLPLATSRSTSGSPANCRD